MSLPATPMRPLPPLQSFCLGETLPGLGVNPVAWETAFEEYLAQLLVQHEDDLHPAVPSRTLTGDQFIELVVLAGRLGAVAGIAAVETLRPPEPPRSRDGSPARGP